MQAINRRYSEEKMVGRVRAGVYGNLVVQWQEELEACRTGRTEVCRMRGF